MDNDKIKTPVIYEARSKTIYQCGGYGVVCKVDEFTHDWNNDASIGRDAYDELCNEVGEQICEALNAHTELVDEVKRLREMLDKYS